MVKTVDLLLKIEEQIILKIIEEKFDDIILEEKIINEMLISNNEYNFALIGHKILISNLISKYIKEKVSDSKSQKELRLLFSSEESMIDYLYRINIDNKSIHSLCELLHIKYLNTKYSIKKGKLIRINSKINVRENGKVYTLDETAAQISSKTISNYVSNGKDIKTAKILDFASGTGRFYFQAYLILKNKYNLDNLEIFRDILHAIDVDEIALDVLKLRVLSILESSEYFEFEAICGNICNKNALIWKTLWDVNKNSFNAEVDLNGILKGDGFDIILSNPPYFLLKVNNKNVVDSNNKYFEELIKTTKNSIEYFKNSGMYNYSIEGMINTYKISLERIIKMTKNKGEIGVICPSSLFGDLSSSKLRRFLLTFNKVREIEYYPESSNLFEGVSQSTVVFHLQKGTSTKQICMKNNDYSFEVDFSDVHKMFNKNLEIPMIDSLGWRVLMKMEKYKKIKHFSSIRNKRGELDLSLNKSFITLNDTGRRLVRGNMIGIDEIKDINKEYVDIDNFIDVKSIAYKEKDYNRERLFCQQISNVDTKKRLKFVISNSTDIAANSCNYISTDSKENLLKLKFILNSYLLNWRFKITSTNNHINNYELNELSIVDLESFNVNIFDDNIMNNNIKICKLYGLDCEETIFILNDFFNDIEIKNTYEIV